MSIKELKAAAAPVSLADACRAALAERELEPRAAQARERSEQPLWSTTESELLRGAAAAHAGARLSEHFADPDRWQVEELPHCAGSSHACASAVVEVERVRVRYRAGRGRSSTYDQNARLYHLRRCPESGSIHPENWRACEVNSLAALAELLGLAAEPDTGAELDRHYPRDSCEGCWRHDQDAAALLAEVDADGFCLDRYGAVDQDAAVVRALAAMRRWFGQAEQLAATDAKHLSVEQCALLTVSCALVAVLHGAHLDIATCPSPEA